MGSGFADYEKIDFGSNDIKKVSIPVVVATVESLGDIAELIDENSFDSTAVTLVPWPGPLTGPLRLSPGTGLSPVAEDEFLVWWEGDLCRGHNKAVSEDKTYVTAKIVKEQNPETKMMVVRELNYHMCGDQIIAPSPTATPSPMPFMLLLAPPSETPVMSEIRAYYFTGTHGVRIRPNVWHNPPIPLCKEPVPMVFRNKQAAIHTCVAFDFINDVVDGDKNVLTVQFPPGI